MGRRGYYYGVKGEAHRHHLSGKSLIYQIPVLERLIHDKNTRAMYIFPTKALAQDQMRALQELIGMCPSLEDVQVSDACKCTLSTISNMVVITIPGCHF